MLVDKKLRANHTALGICTKLGLLPFQLKNQACEMVLNISTIRRIQWIGLLSASIFYAGYINIRLVEAVIGGKETEFSELGIHISRCVMSAVMTFWAYDGLVAHTGEKAAIYNYTNARFDQGEKKKQAKSWHSFVQDLMVLNCPSMLYTIPFYFAGFFLWKTQSTQFLYAAVPERWQTLTALTLCSLFEFLMVLFWMAQAHLFVIVNMLFQQKIEALFGNELHFHAGSLVEDLRHKVVTMREVQAAVGIYSIGNRRSIFAHKVICLSLGVVDFFFFIRLIGVIPFVPVVFLGIGINCLCFYSVIWNNAYMIPTQMEDLRREVLRRIPNGRSKTTAYLKRRVKSVPACAIQVGSFRSMERNSTLLFTDFLFSNLASLLISV